MLPRERWFDRQFEFDLPLWMFPNVVERLRGTPARLEDRLQGLPRERLTQRDGDHWSIQEHAGHLLDLESLWFGRLDDFDHHVATLRAADLTNRATNEANHNAKQLGDILKAFRTARQKLVNRLDRHDAAFVERTAGHPRLGTPMRVLDHAYFIAEHDDHHLAAITELIARR